MFGGHDVEAFTTRSGKLLMRVPQGIAIADYSVDVRAGKFCNASAACMDVYDNGNGTYSLDYNGQEIATVEGVAQGDTRGLFDQYATEKRLSDRKKAAAFAFFMKALPYLWDAAVASSRPSGSARGFDTDRFSGSRSGGSGNETNGNVGGLAIPEGQGVHGSCGGGGC